MTAAAAAQVVGDLLPWRRLFAGNDGSAALETLRSTDAEMGARADDVRRQLLTVLVQRGRAHEAIAELERACVTRPTTRDRG